MKKYSINFSGILFTFRKWLNRKNTDKQQEKAPSAPELTSEEIVHICCAMIGKTQKHVRILAKRFNPDVIEKVHEPGTSLRMYRGLRVESKEYAVWCEFFNADGKPRKENTYLHCRTVLIFFQDREKVYKFLKVLQNEESYLPIWDHRWISMEDEQVKITLGMDPDSSELPCHLAFTIWGN